MELINKEVPMVHIIFVVVVSMVDVIIVIVDVFIVAVVFVVGAIAQMSHGQLSRLMRSGGEVCGRRWSGMQSLTNIYYSGLHLWA